MNEETEQQLRKEFQEWADSGSWRSEDGYTVNFGIGNVEDWWIDKIKKMK